MKKNYKQVAKQYYKIPFVSDFKDMLYKSATRFKKRAAFRLKDKNGIIYTITYDSFLKDVEGLGTALIEQGLEDKRIAVIGANSYRWAISYLAASIIGIVVPIDKDLGNNDIINFLNVGDCSLVIASDEILNNLDKDKLNKKDVAFINMERDLSDIKNEGIAKVNKGNAKFKNIKINPDIMKILIFTSGTTGNAKGVALSHRNICSNFMATSQTVKINSNDQVLSILPLHHTYECTLGFLLIIYKGGCIAYCDGLKYISKNILEYKPSVIIAVPLLIENINKKIMKSLTKNLNEKYKCDFDEKTNISEIFKSVSLIAMLAIKHKVKKSMGGRLRLIITGAAAIKPSIVESFFKLGFKTLQGYGLTECSPLLTGNSDKFHKFDSVGLPIPGVTIKLINCNKENFGEIVAKGPGIMLGYYNDEAQNNKVLKDGWFHTGDIGRIDEDGFLYITGRSKNVIVTKNGKNIYPEELEFYLKENSFIEEALVTGINYINDDETYVNAQIFPNINGIKEYLKRNIITKEEVYAIVKDAIASINIQIPMYKRIGKFTIRDEEFEKTTTKKIKRFGENLKLHK